MFTLIPGVRVFLDSWKIDIVDIWALLQNCMILSSSLDTPHSCKPILLYRLLELALLAPSKRHGSIPFHRLLFLLYFSPLHKEKVLTKTGYLLVLFYKTAHKHSVALSII